MMSFSSWAEAALWLHEQLPAMRFTLNEQYATICTVWIDSDSGNDDVMIVGELLSDFFGAYLCGPMSNYALPGRPAHQSFGFWNQALLENAKRVFPLPEHIQPGPMVMLHSISNHLSRGLERAYNKLPSDLPSYKGN